jgi:CDP-diacylglycerol--serine O-phosphatidyltransferase
MGCIGIYFAMKGDLIFAAYCSALGIFFDFFDGLAARLLKVSSELGKQLDSLADLVTSGVVPALVVFQLINKEQLGLIDVDISIQSHTQWFAFIAFAITLGSAYRLAKFNIDENQSDKFIGLPTPANTILILSLPFILKYENIDWLNELILNDVFLIGLSLLSVVLLNMKVELFSLKLKSLQFNENKVVFLFLIYSVVCLVILKFIGVPVIIISYILISLLNKKNSVKFKT